MSVPFITAKNFLAIKRETTWGTKNLPLAADFNIRLRELSIDLNILMYKRPFASGRHSSATPIPGRRDAPIKFRMDMCCGATAGTPSLQGKVLESCGALETTKVIFSGPLVTSNVINGTVNGVALSPTTFATDSATTLAAIGVKIVAALAALTPTVVATAVVSGNALYITRTTPNAIVALTAFVVTLGASQATATYKVDYNPQGGIDPTTAAITSMDIASSTMVFYYTPPSGQAKLLTVKGAMGNAVITMDDLGQPLFADCEFKAAFVSDTTSDLIAMTSPDTSIPPATTGAVVSKGGVTQRIGKFALDFGNDVQLKLDSSDADGTGYRGAYIASRHPKLTINPQMDLRANDPVIDNWIAGTAVAFSFATGTSGGLKETITAPQAVLVSNKPADRNGESIWEQEYDLVESVGNDEWLLSQSA